MKLVCAWCKRVIRNGKKETVSHGICQECVERVAKDHCFNIGRGGGPFKPTLPECGGWFNRVSRPRLPGSTE